MHARKSARTTFRERCGGSLLKLVVCKFGFGVRVAFFGVDEDGATMPRTKLIRSDLYPYHITSRSNNKDWFYIPIQDVWGYANELLTSGESQFGVQVRAFVLMNNHYHLCLHTPKANIDDFMYYFNKTLSRKISRQACRINRIFGAPYRWNLIKNDAYYHHVLRYIYQNPVRAGLVKNCEDYLYSDLKKQPISPTELEWINTPIHNKETENTRIKLRKFLIH